MPHQGPSRGGRVLLRRACASLERVLEIPLLFSEDRCTLLPVPSERERLVWGSFIRSWGCQGRKLSQSFPQSHLQMNSTLFFCLTHLLYFCGSISLVSFHLG